MSIIAHLHVVQIIEFKIIVPAKELLTVHIGKYSDIDLFLYLHGQLDIYYVYGIARIEKTRQPFYFLILRKM